MARFSRLRRVGMAALALAVVGGLVLWAAGSGAPRTIRRQPLALRSQMAAHRPLRTPPVFAAAASELELRSVSTGRVVKVLRRTGGSWTNNGLAFSPDGRYVYFTLIPKSGRRWSSLLLERMSVATGEQTLVGHGEQPSLSPTGRLLAYASGNDRSAAIVVRDVTTGAERSINISRLLGKRTDLLNASLGWVRNGSELAVFEWCCAMAVSATAAPSGSVRSGTRPDSVASHLVVVSVTPRGGLAARSVPPPAGSQRPETVGTDATQPSSLLVSSLVPGDRAAIGRLRIGGSRATLERILTVPRAQVLGFDPTGRRLLYVLGHQPPGLWTATIQGHRLVQRHQLIERSQLGAVAW